TVLVADTELIGLLGSTDEVTDSVDINPESLDDRELHAAAYEKVRELLDSTRIAAVENFTMLRGRSDPRAVLDVAEAARASAEGRVQDLFCRGFDARERDDDQVAELRDLINSAIVDTLLHGGAVHVLEAADPVDHPLSAVLRY